MNITDGVTVILGLLLAWSLYKAQKDPTVSFNLFDLIMENGKVSKLSCAFMTGLVVLSWIMIRLTLGGDMTEGYMGLFGSIVIAPVIAKLFSPPPVSGTITTGTSTSQTTTQTIDKDKP